MDRTAIYAPEDLQCLRDLDPKRRTLGLVGDWSPPERLGSPLKVLRPDLQRYVDVGELPARYSSYSEADMGLASALRYQAASEDEIVAFFREVQPVGWIRHGLRRDYLDRILARVREYSLYWSSSSNSASSDTNTYSSSLCIDLRAASTPKPKGSLKAGKIDRFEIPAMAEGQQLTQLYSEIAHRFACSERAARTAVSQLLRTGILFLQEDPGNRLIKHVYANEARVARLTQGRFLSLSAVVHFWPDQYGKDLVDSFVSKAERRDDEFGSQPKGRERQESRSSMPVAASGSTQR